MPDAGRAAGVLPAVRRVPRLFWLARVMLLVQGGLCLLGAGFIPGISHSVAAAAVATSIIAAIGLVHVAVAAALRRGRGVVRAAAIVLECFWVPAGLLLLTWPSGSQGYLDYFFALLVAGSAASVFSLLAWPSERVREEPSAAGSRTPH